MPDPTEAEALAAEVQRLREERDRLADETVRLDRRLHGGRTRRVLVGTLVVLTCLSFLAASTAFWVNRNLLDTDVWVGRVAPLASDPAVQAALADAITAQVLEVVDPEALFEEALPERGQVLAGPLAGVVDSFVADVVRRFVASDAFAELWTRLNEQGHRGAVALLRGQDPDSPLVDAEAGTVTVSLVPAIDAVLTRISEVSPEVLGRTVDLPELQVDDLPDAARAEIGDALGVTLDDDFGVITVYDGDALSASQTALRWFDRLLVVSTLLTLALLAATLATSRQRRRTGLQLLVGFALALVLVRRLALRLVDDVVALAQVPGDQAALDAILRAFADPLLDATHWILAALGAAVVVLLVSGPYPWARALRGGVAGLARGTAGVAHGAAGALGDQGRQDAAVAWVRRRSTALRAAGLVVAVAVLWWGDLSWLGLVVLVALVGAWEIWLGRLLDAPDAPDETGTASAT